MAERADRNRPYNSEELRSETARLMEKSQRLRTLMSDLLEKATRIFRADAESENRSENSNLDATG